MNVLKKVSLAMTLNVLFLLGVLLSLDSCGLISKGLVLEITLSASHD